MQIQRVTVVGAGTMGSGIAQAFAQAGFAVQLHDVDEKAIARGLERLRGPLEKRVAAGKMEQAELDGLFARLQPAADFQQAAQADMVIEAIFEDLKVKQELFGRLSKACDASTILATNTSSLRVADLAAVTKNPERVIGLHFFFPAHINKLVEVVRGPATSDQVFDALFEAARQAGKVPIETSDSPGFCVNRFFVPWINESCRLLSEGYSIATIETAAKQAFGIGMGPFELMNVTGVPISLHAQSTLHQHLGPFYEPAATLRSQVEKKAQWDLQGEPDASAFEAVAARLRGVVYGIACHLVADGVASMADTDKGATVGLRWAQGPFRMMNQQGAAAALADVQLLHDAWGDAFPKPAALAELAKREGEWPLPDVHVSFQDEGRIATILFDRPAALNALNAKVLLDLEQCLDAIAARKGVRAVIVTGEGRAFIAGADIPTMQAMDAAEAAAYTALGHRVLGRLSDLPMPTIMALNGHTLGGGLELALCGDLLLASDKATLGLPEVGLGIHPGFGGTQRLPRRIGMAAAKEMVLTGRTWSPAEALAKGLVNEVLPHAELQARALALARLIASKAPLAVAGAKRAMEEGWGRPLGEALAGERESVALLFATADKKEGLGAFLERREPTFGGR
jgi:enoyl-CoA hydratase / 3-hydroxyacyl-CoA dehydrogenase